MTVDNLPPLTIVPASAGSGKTHFIQDELTRWVGTPGNAPEKIVAVTFTEAAAGELRSRIRSALVGSGKLDEAMALDRAYISTIHGFGLRLLTEFAFDAGRSPLTRKLNDDEQQVLISRTLARSSAAGEMMGDLYGFGYRDSYGGKNPKTSEQVFRQKVLELIATLRSIGRGYDAAELIPAAQDIIKGKYGTATNAEHLNTDLHDAVLKLLEQFDRDISGEVSIGKDPTLKLKQSYKDLDAARSISTIGHDWQLWKRLAEMVTFKTKGKLPPGYNELAEQVNAAASRLSEHPGPLEDACLHVKLLIEAAAESLKNYAADKEQRGLLDFTDMLSSALLLLTDETVVSELLQRVGILVIDEFQDTNPLQFSLLWTLTRRGVPTIIVGDVKQAIMGFQNADPRLLEALPGVPDSTTKPLAYNWRATKELMAWVNVMAAKLFPEEYQPLGEHEKKDTFANKAGLPLEVIDLADSLRKNEDKASHTARRIYELLSDESLEVYDKLLKKHHRLRGGDIALLVPSHTLMSTYAAALREAGIPCRFQEEGWFASTIVLTACQALAYVADHDDRHAALCLAVTGFGGHTLESALKVMVSGGNITESPLHGALRDVALHTADLSVGQVLLEIITVLKMYETITAWEDAPQARANLLRLQAECREFENANRDAMACGGYYGSGIKTFLAWLKKRVDANDKQPPPLVHDQDAVELVTWHSSKGREWPVLIVCGLYIDCAKNRFPEVQVTYTPDAFDNLDTILQKAAVQIVPGFASPESNDRMKTLLQEEAEKSATRLLYVAMTRAREKLIIEWPSWTIGSKSRTTRYFVDLFAEKTGARIVTETTGENFMQFGESFKFPCHLITVTKDKGHWECAVPLTLETLPPIGRNAIKPGTIDHSRLVDEVVTPSSRHGRATEPIFPREYKYGSEIKVKLPGITDAAEKGKVLHRVFEVLSGHPERKSMLSDAVGMELPEETVDAISTAVSSFDTWRKMELKPVAVSTEVPLLALIDGTVVHGFADMVVETADGVWIVDHKSDHVPDEISRRERFNYYYPQLQCYASCMKRPVIGVVVNWINFGRVSLIEYEIPTCNFQISVEA